VLKDAKKLDLKAFTTGEIGSFFRPRFIINLYHTALLPTVKANFTDFLFDSTFFPSAA